MTDNREAATGCRDTVIRVGEPLITLVNVFTVDPAAQTRLVALLDDATEQVMRHRPGFISANIHASLDGTKVVNYAQWRSQDDFEAMLADERAQSHMREAAGLAQFEPNLYRVASVHHE
jgi:quinol monooxygenase YgiN